LATLICSTVRHSGSKMAGEATTIATHRARDVATFSLLPL
jgi:hypothetical protein